MELYDRIISSANISFAHYKARKGKGKYQQVQMVNNHLDLLYKIQDSLTNFEYKVSPYKAQTIYEGKERTLLKLPYYPDRIIQWAIMLQLEPIFMGVFHPNACASIKGRGIDWAYKLAEDYTRGIRVDSKFLFNPFKNDDSKYRFTHCLKIDIRKFYPSIDHEILKNKLRKIIQCERTLKLLDTIIDSTDKIRPEISKLQRGKGLPIGSYLSQYFANYYLTELDWYLQNLESIRFIRYMDDYLIFCDNPKTLGTLAKHLKEVKLPDLKLKLKKNWQIYNLTKEGIDFVGYRFYRRYTKLRKETALKMKKFLNAKNAPSYFGLIKRFGGKALLRKYFIENPEISQNLKLKIQTLLNENKKFRHTFISQDNYFLADYKIPDLKYGIPAIFAFRQNSLNF